MRPSLSLDIVFENFPRLSELFPIFLHFSFFPFIYSSMTRIFIKGSNAWILFSCSAQTSSKTFTLKHSFASLGCFIASKTSKLTSSSYAHTLSFPLSTSIMTLAVFMNGLPKIKGTLASSSISITTKSTGNRNLSTFTIISSTIP